MHAKSGCYRQHAESSLVKCHKGDHVLCTHHDPLTHKVIQMLLHDIGRSTILFLHGLGGKEKHHSLNPSNLSFSLSFLQRKEEDEKTMANCVRGHKGGLGCSFPFIAPRCRS
jgi:hypothetical protein